MASSRRRAVAHRGGGQQRGLPRARRRRHRRRRRRRRRRRPSPLIGAASPRRRRRCSAASPSPPATRHSGALTPPCAHLVAAWATKRARAHRRRHRRRRRRRRRPLQRSDAAPSEGRRARLWVGGWGSSLSRTAASFLADARRLVLHAENGPGRTREDARSVATQHSLHEGRSIDGATRGGAGTSLVGVRDPLPTGFGRPGCVCSRLGPLGVGSSVAGRAWWCGGRPGRSLAGGTFHGHTDPITSTRSASGMTCRALQVSLGLASRHNYYYTISHTLPPHIARPTIQPSSLTLTNHHNYIHIPFLFSPPPPTHLTPLPKQLLL